MKFPLSFKAYLQAVACETAKMSYPGRMSTIVERGTKNHIEKYFVNCFPIDYVWCNASKIVSEYDNWHRDRVLELSNILDTKKCIKKLKSPSVNNSVAIAAKFMNTFMHQLMKYESCRILWDKLHLPLDGTIFQSLRNQNSLALKDVKEIFKKSPYSLSYEEYSCVQNALLLFIEELNNLPRMEYKLKSRIELNVLWSQPS